MKHTCYLIVVLFALWAMPVSAQSDPPTVIFISSFTGAMTSFCFNTPTTDLKSVTIKNTTTGEQATFLGSQVEDCTHIWANTAGTEFTATAVKQNGDEVFMLINYVYTEPVYLGQIIKENPQPALIVFTEEDVQEVNTQCAFLLQTTFAVFITDETTGQIETFQNMNGLPDCAFSWPNALGHIFSAFGRQANGEEYELQIAPVGTSGPVPAN